MALYKKMLAEIHNNNEATADGVVEVVYGMPVFVKGQNPARREQEENVMQKGTKKQKNTSSVSLKMVIGGAFQAKRKFAEQTYGNIQWGGRCRLP